MGDRRVAREWQGVKQGILAALSWLVGKPAVATTSHVNMHVPM